MYIKSFTAPSVSEAVKAVKAEMGDDALILSNKRIKEAPGAVFEIIAAVDYDLSKPVNLKGVAVSRHHAPPAPKTPAQKAPHASLENARPPVAVNTDEAFKILKKELKELKELKDLCWAVVSGGKAAGTNVFSRIEEEMVRGGIDRRLVQKILIKTMKGVSKEKASDIGYFKAFMREAISPSVNVTDPLKDNGVVAFVGPTGVGKTTTIAKLAAFHALKKRRKVAMLTMDTYRIAAAEQLKVYGKIIGVPVDVATTTKELGYFIRMHSDKDLILIDTAGRSRRTAAHLRELQELASMGQGIRFNLVLSAPTRDDALYDSVRAFGIVPVDSLTFTKLDESPVCGQMLNTIVLAKRPVAYLTTGQKVPEDIEIATRERLLGFFIPN